MKKIKNRKAAGLDEIPPEVWKTRKFDDILLRHCNAVCNQNPIDRWMKGCILPFPKKGNLGLAKNYRGITLTSIAAKIYNMMLYRNAKVKVRSLDGDTDYFDIVADVLQGVTLAPYLFIICLDYVLRTSIDKIKENGFKLTKERSRRYPTKTITDADYTDDIALLTNVPAQAETLLHSLEWAFVGIGLHVNTYKTEYMCLNQTGSISTLKGSALKLVDKFTYLESSVSSTETDIDIRLAKAWTAIDRQSVVWKLDLTDKKKHSFS